MNVWVQLSIHVLTHLISVSKKDPLGLSYRENVVLKIHEQPGCCQYE